MLNARSVACARPYLAGLDEREDKPLPLFFVSSTSLTSAAISMNPLSVKRTAFCPMLTSTCPQKRKARLHVKYQIPGIRKLASARGQRRQAQALAPTPRPHI
eukprot:1083396-Pleurochrysis_carterae.AAC.2